MNRARKALEAARADVVEALRIARYFVRQADWLQERFPEARLRDAAPTHAAYTPRAGARAQRGRDG